MYSLVTVNWGQSLKVCGRSSCVELSISIFCKIDVVHCLIFKFLTNTTSNLSMGYYYYHVGACKVTSKYATFLCTLIKFHANTSEFQPINHGVPQSLQTSYCLSLLLRHHNAELNTVRPSSGCISMICLAQAMLETVYVPHKRNFFNPISGFLLFSLKSICQTAIF